MKSYSEDLRKKIVVAVERGRSNSERGRPPLRCEPLLAQALQKDGPPGKLIGSEEGTRQRTPRVDEKTTRLLNEDMKERPAATISERLHFLEAITGKRLSYSTLWRVLKRLGFSRRKDRWVHQSETSF